MTKLVEKLRQDGPTAVDELPEITEEDDSEVVGILGVPTAATTIEKTPVCYLYGQERRAVREYIRTNEEFVESCMGSESSPIYSNLEDYWLQMFCEEWVWSGKDLPSPEL